MHSFIYAYQILALTLAASFRTDGICDCPQLRSQHSFKAKCVYGTCISSTDVAQTDYLHAVVELKSTN